MWHKLPRASLEEEASEVSLMNSGEGRVGWRAGELGGEGGGQPADDGG